MPEITITYRRISNEVPPRCRNPRYVSYDESVTIGLREFDKHDAKKAFTVVTSGCGMTGVTDIYSIEGLLYSPVTADDSSRVRFDDEEFPKVREYPNRVVEASTPEEGEDIVRSSFAGRYILVRGVIFQACLEPQWRVISPMVGSPLIIAEVPQSRLSTRSSEVIFRADEKDEAIAYARNINRSKEGVCVVDSINVRDPESVRLVTVLPESKEVDDLRFDYSIACSDLAKAKTNEEESLAFERVAALRGELLGAGAMPKATTMEPYEDRPGVAERMGL